MPASRARGRSRRAGRLSGVGLFPANPLGRDRYPRSLLVALAAACCMAPHPGLATDDATAPIAIDHDDAARLRALGYVEFAEDEAEPVSDGVSLLNPQAAAAGLTLVVSSTGCSAHLLDLAGEELHHWTQARCRQWWGAALMHDGDLVVNGSLVTPPPPEHPDPAAARPVAAAKGRARFAARIASTGETRWILMMRSHHQLETTPRGEILVLTEATVRDERSESLRERLGERMGSLVLHDNLLRWLSVDGSLIDTLSLLDAIDAGGAAFPFADPERLLEGPKHIGLFHCNSAYSMDQPHLEGRGPLYDADNVLTTSRNQDRVFIVNRESRSLVWAWGRDELQAPHSATWLPNGNFLVFDNGVDRERSRVIEVDPAERAIVWQYPPDMQGGGIEFFTKSRGMAQRLDNGNTLIVESNAGKAFEITPSGGLVWQYHTPLTDEGKRPVLITLRRYPKSWLEVALPEQPARAALHPKR